MSLRPEGLGAGMDMGSMDPRIQAFSQQPSFSVATMSTSAQLQDSWFYELFHTGCQCTAAADHPADSNAATDYFAACPVITTAVHPDGATTAAAPYPDVTAVTVPAAIAIITQRQAYHTSTTATSSVAIQFFTASQFFPTLFVSAVVIQ